MHGTENRTLEEQQEIVRLRAQQSATVALTEDGITASYPIEASDRDLFFFHLDDGDTRLYYYCDMTEEDIASLEFYVPVINTNLPS